MSGILRSDIRSSFDSYSGTAEGVMAKVTLKVVNTKGGCVPLSGYAVYLWHCTRDGKYSLYTDANQNYLRGMQEADDAGLITFTTIFPGCYSGRWPHIHFEVYGSARDAIAGRGKVKTSQMALPQDACSVVYNTASGYAASVANLAQTSLMTDMVFSDGYTLELPTVTGNPSDGYAISLTVGVAV
jgi:protocatechuate 3,4-dioxygenase beta subunit